MKVNKKSSSDNLRDNKKPKKSRKSINKEIKRKRKRDKHLQRSLMNLNLINNVKIDSTNGNSKTEDCDSVIIIDDSIVSENVNIIADNEVIEIVDDSTACDDSDVIYVGKTYVSDLNANEKTINTKSVNEPNEPTQISTITNQIENLGVNNIKLRRISLVSQQAKPLLPQNLDFIPLNFNCQIRGTNLPNRGTNFPNRGTILPNRGTNLSSRGTNLPSRGTNFPIRGSNLPCRGMNFSNRQTIVSNRTTNRCNPSVHINQECRINKFGDNIYNAGTVEKKGLRMIVIDGSNVAMGHSNGKIFSVKGLKICTDYFLKRGHKVVAFVPQFRLKINQSSDAALLKKLQKDGHVVATPSRDLDNRRICSYDDRFIVQCAAENDGIIVSSDNFRDLMRENSKWKETIEQRLLMPTWVDDIIMFPKDPLGKQGPDLDEFLKFPEN